MIKKSIKYVMMICVTILAGILYSCESDKNTIKLQESEAMSATEDVDIELGTETAGNVICVHITGCVVNAGVYTLPEGCRVYEVIQAAGGFLPEADMEYLNLAAIVKDGQRIKVLSKEEAQTAEYYDEYSKQETNSKININTASKESLMTLPGIGESRANSIITYREENGGFTTIEDIMKISGIKEAAFKKIKDYICIK